MLRRGADINAQNLRGHTVSAKRSQSHPIDSIDTFINLLCYSSRHRCIHSASRTSSRERIEKMHISSITFLLYLCQTNRILFLHWYPWLTFAHSLCVQVLHYAFYYNFGELGNYLVRNECKHIYTDTDSAYTHTWIARVHEYTHTQAYINV